LGGLSGIAGPQKIGFGSFTVAGQVVRREVLPHRIFGDTPCKVDKALAALVDSPNRIVKLNLEYIGNLFALRSCYENVRLSRITTLPDYEHLRIVTQAASELLSVCIDERVERLRSYLEERNLPLPPLSFGARPCLLNVKPDTPYVDHVKWVSGLSDGTSKGAHPGCSRLLRMQVGGKGGAEISRPAWRPRGTHTDGRFQI